VSGVAHGAVSAAGGATRVTLLAVESAAGLIRERIIDAAQKRTPLRIVGRGTWLDAGRASSATEVLSTRDLAGVTQYVPGDLTITALAGTTLADLRATTAAHGQWLALDPHGSEEGTIGATVATGSAGPLASAFGKARDLVLGVEFVTGTGAIARGGGRVVKNVAGFDLVRLMTGAWGTLGVITEVTMRLHAKPPVDESIAVSVDAREAAARVRQLLRRLPFAPYACELLNPALASTLLGTNGLVAVVRMGGNEESVKSQRVAFREIGDVTPINGDVWQRLRTSEPAHAIVFRLSRLPAQMQETWDEASAVAASCAGTLVHASPMRGVVRCIIQYSDDAVAQVRRVFASSSTARRIGERLPAQVWADRPSPTADPLSSGIKRTFDPSGILNPGVIGDLA
jgi:glycolate oxidase FAD binding subunit